MSVQHTQPGRSVDARRLHQAEGDGWKITVLYGMSYPLSAHHPLFTVTASFDQHGDRRHGHHPDLVAKYAPEIADLLPWHLCDSDGLPTNYDRMASYWGTLALHGSNPNTALGLPAGCADYADALARALRCAQAGDRDSMNRLLRQWRDTGESRPFFAWTEERKPKLKTGFMAACCRHGLDRIEIEVPVGEPYVVSAQTG